VSSFVPPQRPADLPAPGQPFQRPAAAPPPPPSSPRHEPAPWPDAPPAARPATPPAPQAAEATELIPPGTLEPAIIAALRTCFDPEIPLNVYDLNLIYGIEVDPHGNVEVRMTLTSPTCPVAGTLPGEVQQKVAAVPGVHTAHVALVWDPPWEPSMLSEAARLQLGLS
jgi:FeS assembly SUF system protein